MSPIMGQPKETLRSAHLARRRDRSAAERAQIAEALAFHAATLPALTSATRVAAYLSMASEPGTGPLLELLAGRGTEVLVPISHPERSMTWVDYSPGEVSVGPLGVPEPDSTGEPRQLSACEFALIPAVAVDHRGNRLGRGAGYYDRALADFSGVVCAVVFADELVEHLAAEPHDRRVDLVLTEAGVFRPEQP